MKTKAGNIYSAAEALKVLKDIRLPAKGAYRVGRLIQKMDSELRVLEEQRLKLVNELGAKDDNGNTTVQQENLPKFIEQWQAVLDSEIEMEAQPIPVASLGDAAISPQVLLGLGDFIEE